MLSNLLPKHPEKIRNVPLKRWSGRRKPIRTRNVCPRNTAGVYTQIDIEPSSRFLIAGLGLYQYTVPGMLVGGWRSPAYTSTRSITGDHKIGPNIAINITGGDS